MSHYQFDTLKIRGGYDARQHNYAVSVPIYQTAAYALETVDRTVRLWKTTLLLTRQFISATGLSL